MRAKLLLAAIVASVAAGWATISGALPQATPDPCGIALARREHEINAVLQACADRGDAAAQAEIGIWLLGEGAGDTPLGDREREAEGMRLIRAAANGGSAEAQNELGLAFLEGRFGLEADAERALHWFETATRNNDIIAPFNLARMYFSGRGVAQSFMRGEAYLRLSATRGYKPARCSLARLIEPRPGGHAEAQALRELAARSDSDYECAQYDIMTELPNY